MKIGKVYKLKTRKQLLETGWRETRRFTFIHPELRDGVVAGMMGAKVKLGSKSTFWRATSENGRGKWSWHWKMFQTNDFEERTE